MIIFSPCPLVGPLFCGGPCSAEHAACLNPPLPQKPAPETGTRKLASVSGAGFSRQLQNF